MARATTWRRRLAPAASLAAGVRAAVERTAFWLAIALVAGYPAVLVAARLTAVPPTALLALLGSHLLTIALGHRYDPGGTERRHDDDAADDGVRSAGPMADD